MRESKICLFCGKTFYRKPDNKFNWNNKKFCDPVLCGRPYYNKIHNDKYKYKLLRQTKQETIKTPDIDLNDKNVILDENACFEMITYCIRDCFSKKIYPWEKEKKIETEKFLKSKLVALWADCSDTFSQRMLIKEYEEKIKH
jgi:hypothetical protein